MSVDYNNKTVLAPMVRVSLLPFRLLCLKYGADLVYNEEVIDFKILQSRRVKNETLGTIDFVLPDGTYCFRTCPEEKNKVVFQMGTANAQRALKAAKMIEQDVAAIDINMGCPKEYSTKGGMGSALLTNPDNIKDILTTLVKGLNIPVTCKIRVLPELSQTLDLVRMIATTGVSALAVHGRTRYERPQHRNRDEVIAAIVKEIDIPVLANGGSKDSLRFYEDIAYFRQSTCVSSVMIARAAMHFPPIFKDPSTITEAEYKELRDPENIIKDYLKFAVRYDIYASSAKYCIQQLLHENTEGSGYRETLSANDLESLCEVWGLSEYYKSELDRRRLLLKRTASDDSSLDPENLIKRAKPNEKITTELEYLPNGCSKLIKGESRYIKHHYDPTWSPKQILFEHCKKIKWKPPLYKPIFDSQDRLFFSSVLVNGVKYINLTGDKSKRYSEQSVAIICLQHLEIPDGSLKNSAS